MLADPAAGLAGLRRPGQRRDDRAPRRRRPRGRLHREHDVPVVARGSVHARAEGRRSRATRSSTSKSSSDSRTTGSRASRRTSASTAARCTRRRCASSPRRQAIGTPSVRTTLVDDVYLSLLTRAGRRRRRQRARDHRAARGVAVDRRRPHGVRHRARGVAGRRRNPIDPVSAPFRGRRDDDERHRRTSPSRSRATGGGLHRRRLTEDTALVQPPARAAPCCSSRCRSRVVMLLLVAVLVTRKSAADRADYDPLHDKPAPEIVGTTLDGKPFDLDDYRGRVGRRELLRGSGACRASRSTPSSCRSAQRHEQAKDGVQLVSVVFNDDLDKVQGRSSRRTAATGPWSPATPGAWRSTTRWCVCPTRTSSTRSGSCATGCNGRSQNTDELDVHHRGLATSCSGRAEFGSGTESDPAPAAGSTPARARRLRAAPDREAQAQLRA